MIYITGDTHRNFTRVKDLCLITGSTTDDVLIILGDAGINYYGEPEDRALKEQLSKMPITLLCLHGNHEIRPENIDTYEEIEWCGGAVYWEPEFPNLLFARDGEVYNLEGNRCIVIGGAYSVDKYYRLRRGMNWWPDEQPSNVIKDRVEARLEEEGWKVDIVLSHTCPYRYIPREVFLPSINQASVDNSTEEWLDAVEDKLTYSSWYCAHFHTYKSIDKMTFLFNDFLELLKVQHNSGL
ncbi:MAG: metallophosphoesterase [Clostridiales bacterium]|nr:metallophosphoesterase [Clostridiales bacterium]